MLQNSLKMYKTLARDPQKIMGIIMYGYYNRSFLLVTMMMIIYHLRREKTRRFGKSLKLQARLDNMNRLAFVEISIVLFNF